jgi:UDP-perosamine 4-acetyltransferase
MKDLILLGGGGHALVCADLAMECGHTILGYTAPYPSTVLPSSIPYLGEDDEIKKFSPNNIKLINGLGFTPKETNLRKFVYKKYSQSHHFPELIHPRAFVSKLAKIHSGVQIMAGVIIQAGTVIRENSIINTSVNIDHNCDIGNQCHIAPGSTLCGSVITGDSVFIGAGSIINPNITISKFTVINSGINITHSIIESSYVNKISTNLIQKVIIK